MTPARDALDSLNHVLSLIKPMKELQVGRRDIFPVQPIDFEEWPVSFSDYFAAVANFVYTHGPALRDALARVEGEPVATLLLPDPESADAGPWLSLEDWENLRELPAGTKLYTKPTGSEK